MNANIEVVRATEENVRIREWLMKTTGIDSILLSDHIKWIDAKLKECKS